MNTLLKTVKILGLSALLLQGTTAFARIQILEVSCVQAGIPAERIGNRISASGSFRIHRQGSTRGTLTVTTSGSSRPQSYELEVAGLTLNNGVLGISDLNAPTVVQLISSETDKNRATLKKLGLHSVSLLAVSGNLNGDIDIDSEGKSTLTTATVEQVSENDGTEVIMSCILKR